MVDSVPPARGPKLWYISRPTVTTYPKRKVFGRVFLFFWIYDDLWDLDVREKMRDFHTLHQQVGIAGPYARYQPVALDKMLLCQVPKRMIQMIAGYPLISCASTYETSPKTMMIHHWTPYWSINVDILQFLSLCKSITATPPKKSEA
jgi:hypothetical protein